MHVLEERQEKVAVFDSSHTQAPPHFLSFHALSSVHQKKFTWLQELYYMYPISCRVRVGLKVRCFNTFKFLLILHRGVR